MAKYQKWRRERERGLCVRDGCLFMACLLLFSSFLQTRWSLGRRRAGGPAPRRSKVSPYLLNLPTVDAYDGFMLKAWRRRRKKKPFVSEARESGCVSKSTTSVYVKEEEAEEDVHCTFFFFFSLSLSSFRLVV